MTELLATQAESQAAALKGRLTVAAKLKELTAQRHHVTRQNVFNGQKLELPAAPADLLALYMKVNQYRYHRGPERVGWFSPTSGPQELKNVAAALGVEVPRGEQQAVA